MGGAGGLDVVIPTRDALETGDGAARLGRAVASARGVVERAGGGRVVVVDDGSARAVEGHEAVRGAEVLRRAEGGGPSAARNEGLARTTGAWVALLDDDDELLAEGVLAAVALAERLGEGTGAVVSARVEVREGMERLRSAPAEWVGRTLARAGDVFRPIGLFGASGVVLRGAVVRSVGFDEGLWIGEDRDYLRRVAGAGWGVAVNAEASVRVTLREEGNLSSFAHLSRRAGDHAALLERWWDEDSADHLREATRWLIGRCAKAGVDRASWETLTAAARARGIRVGWKARARRALGGKGGRA